MIIIIDSRSLDEIGEDSYFNFFKSKGFSCNRCGFVATFQAYTVGRGSHGLRFVGKAKDGYRFLTKDHIIPKSKGGKGKDNYQILCDSCNSKKGNRSEGEDILIYLKSRKKVADKILRVLNGTSRL